MPTTTAEKTATQPSSSGPATYTGGAPLPSEPAQKATPAEKRQEEQHHEKATADARVEHAKAAHKENKEHKKGAVDKARSAAQVAGAKATAALSHAQHSASDKFEKKSGDAEQKWFSHAFPHCHKHEHVKEVYQCTYVDGKAQEIVGKLAVTDGGIHFADGNKDKEHTVQESLPYKLTASLHVDLGQPRQLDVYTTDRKVYHFKNFRSKSLHHVEVDETLMEAHNWIDFYWRKAGVVPNPAATYHSS
ncbi:hypothetical protein DIPPA_02897 [Diplonema papillatum]|nr:hypothetical protein DIPPA_02897 [Diplonema papillatum]|eukprot:gene2864-4494_t